jgi:hypothetical protein
VVQRDYGDLDMIVTEDWLLEMREKEKEGRSLTIDLSEIACKQTFVRKFLSVIDGLDL